VYYTSERDKSGPVWLSADSRQHADVDVDVVDLRAQADASMPASNNNVIIIQYI